MSIQHKEEKNESNIYTKIKALPAELQEIIYGFDCTFKHRYSKVIDEINKILSCSVPLKFKNKYAGIRWRSYEQR